MVFVPRKSAVVLLIIGLAAPALAQPTPAPGTPPVAPTKDAEKPMQPGDNSTIATPPADASPSKIEEAKDVARKAKLTPIVPSPHDATRPAFQLYAEVDLPIVAVGLVIAAARILKTQPAFCAPLCNKADLNGLDRLTAGYWSPTWSLSSDIALYGMGAGAVALLVHDEGVLDMLNDGVVIAEATLSATAVASIMTLSAGRPRPYLFGDKAPLANRNSADAGLSFLSSHTAEAFAVATSLYITERRLHPNNATRRRVVLGAGLTVASFIGIARIMSGNHFITDVVGGAIVGTSLGVLVGSIHGSPVQVVPVMSESSAGVGVSGGF